MVWSAEKAKECCRFAAEGEQINEDYSHVEDGLLEEHEKEEPRPVFRPSTG